MEAGMLSPEYYRRQADICLGMALAARDQSAAEECRALALAFLAKAAEAEGEGATGDVLQEQGRTQTELSHE
jgi:hypothetical protein